MLQIVGQNEAVVAREIDVAETERDHGVLVADLLERNNLARLTDASVALEKSTQVEPIESRDPRGR